jgi:hypothetical protein
MSLTPKLPSRSAWTSTPTWRSAQLSGERRDLDRVPLAIFIDEYVEDRPYRALTTNVSATGLYMHRVSRKATQKFGRSSRLVQLELTLPGTKESIWARGQIRYDELGDDLVHGTGVRLTAMARGHQSLLEDYLYDYKKKRLEQILQLIRENRYH